MNNSILFFFSLLLINSALAGTKKIPVGQTVDDCLGIEDGDYQSPDGCHYYVTCANNHIERKRPCPTLGVILLDWDDNLKKCVYYSETCPDGPVTPEVTTPKITTPEVTTPKVTTPEVTTSKVTTPKVTTPKVTTPEVTTPRVTTPEITIPTLAPEPGPDPCNPCIKNCDGKPLAKQRYQSCNGCTVYATCENGKFTDNIPCCEEKHFDDNLKQCVKPGTSTTCPRKLFC